ncbi:hypothetical protein HZ326_13074 [Fusarium oxysporum f. sp. albedinis]|nr:hypothetical protein HZ326_13074 [Fusarium oxysporum f. sp. albedinis]
MHRAPEGTLGTAGMTALASFSGFRGYHFPCNLRVPLLQLIHSITFEAKAIHHKFFPRLHRISRAWAWSGFCSSHVLMSSPF